MRVALALLLLALASASASASGCSLVLDAGSLTDGTSSAGRAGSSGSSGGSGGNVALCASSCDGLDADCKSTLDEPACPQGCDGRVFNGTPYMGCTGSATFADAEVRCTEQGMHLARIGSAAENAVAVEIAQTLGSYVWIGGSDLGSLDAFTWIDGTVFYQAGTPVEGVYQNFDADQPSADTSRHCVELHNDALGPWSTARCSDVKQFICKRD